jgi:hypothetical protein
VGSVAGLLNSMGSAGSIFQSGATAYISRAFGWPALFGLFVLCSLISALILFQVAARTSPAVGHFFEAAIRPGLTLALLACIALAAVTGGSGEAGLMGLRGGGSGGGGE